MVRMMMQMFVARMVMTTVAVLAAARMLMVVMLVMMMALSMKFTINIGVYQYVDFCDDMNTYNVALVLLLLRRLPMPCRAIVEDASQTVGSHGATTLPDHARADALRNCSAQSCLLSSWAMATIHSNTTPCR